MMVETVTLGVLLVFLMWSVGICARQLGRIADTLARMEAREAGPINTRYELHSIAAALRDREGTRHE